MMNKKILIVLALSGILLGCSQAPIAPDTSALANCRTQGSWFCKGDPQNPTVNLNTKSGKLKASPYCVKVNTGTQIKINLTPPGNKALNTVEIIPKDPDHTWLAGTNSASQDEIIIDVPNDLDEKERYYYGIKTDTDCVDPRAKVYD